MRITDQQLVNITQYDMNTAYENLAQAQTVLSTGQQINTPADNPAGTATALMLQGSLSQDNGYSAAINDATGWLQTTETALQGIGDALMQVRTLAVQGANDTLTAQDRQALAAQVGQIIGGAINAANAKYGSRYVLSGTKTSTAPFSLAPGATTITYNGDDNAIAPELAPGQTVQINSVSPPQSQQLSAVFNAMLAIQSDLQNNNGAAAGGADLTALDAAHDGLLTAEATTGAATSRVQQLNSMESSTEETLQSQISAVLDADLAQASVEFSSRQAAYQATLQAAAKVIQPSLLQFLQ